MKCYACNEYADEVSKPGDICFDCQEDAVKAHSELMGMNPDVSLEILNNRRRQASVARWRERKRCLTARSR